ncbi:MAG: dicarboxylate/amino acid:cation symporter [Brevundimonas sp.]|uniref:dicarboxylate/amino acid:cation symporter n=1 Tax=Brevundimonas sp. TaxID=1871086 RepID=UPI00273288D3|nr:dicarboxylate/amino acid:cation symporter [Brevundimonas sp.]MDP3656543.1 dicarboxylate/amino acid:cation symporter [Brevundimonas sp.]MDZ4109116.1 dicarboxylate/amino acid:cation symporter [Brevundimonas sp.]
MTEDSHSAAEEPPRGPVYRYWFGVKLWKRILAALVLGAIVGLIWGEGAVQIKWIGDLFVRLIQMVVIPLVFLTIVSGVVSLQDPRRLGSLGLKTLFLYLLTTALAIVIGLILGALVQPGLGVDFAGAVPREVEAAQPFAGLLESIVPTNPIKALAEGQVLSVIFFALIFGAGVLVAGAKGAAAADAINAGAEAMLKVVNFVMEVAPFGVFALIAWVMGTTGPATFVNVALLAFCVIVGCILQILLVHGGLIKLLARLPAWPFFRDVTDAGLVAFSTSSSSATLPVSMAVAEANLGIKRPVFSTVLPLGVTISMDGTALYIALLASFAAQAFGISLDMMDYALIALTTVLVSIGTAPVPSASLFMLAAVLQVIGVSPAQTALLVGFILPFDRILDMTRTVANVISDLAVATIVGRWENEIDIEAYKAPPVK